MPMMLAMMDWAEKYDDATEVPPEFINKLRADPAALKQLLQQELLDNLPKWMSGYEKLKELTSA